MAKKIDTIVEARLAMTGGMYYIRIPRTTVQFYDLKLGDKLKVKILEARGGD